MSAINIFINVYMSVVLLLACQRQNGMADSRSKSDSLTADDFQAKLEELLSTARAHDLDPSGGWDVVEGETQSRFEVHITPIVNSTDS